MPRADPIDSHAAPPPAPSPITVGPVARRSLVDEVVEALGRPICHGQLEPGAPLPPELTMAEQLGVRRGTLHEGVHVQRLQQAGLVGAIASGDTARAGRNAHDIT